MDPALDLAAAIRARSWAWLFQLGSALNLDVRIVDARSAPVLSAPSETPPAALHDPEFIAAVGRAQRAQSVETVQVGRISIACIVLRVAGAEGAVLTLSRRTVTKQGAGSDQMRLEQVATILRAAVEAHLQSDAGSSADAHRLKALRRALADVEAESELDLVRVFSDAVSIWEDVDVRAYSQGVNGEYVRQWVPPGAPADEIPAVLSVPLALQTRELATMPQELDQQGSLSSDEIVVAQIALTGSRWMLMFTRLVDPACLNRLALYVDVLEESLRQQSISITLQVCRSVWDHLLAADDNAVSADAALTSIVRAVGGDFGALLVTFPHGGRALAAGAVERFAPKAATPPTELAATRLLAQGGTLVVGVGRAEGRPPFSSGARILLDTVADMLESWAAAIVRRPTVSGERRAAARPFQQVIEEVAQQTVRSGGSVSVVVIRLGAAAFRPGAAHRLAAQIRGHLRAAEPAGALTDGEIAAVLFDTNPDQARSVVARLRALGASLDEGEALATAAMGIAHCAPGSVYDTSLVLAARQDALREGGANSPGGRIQ